VKDDAGKKKQESKLSLKRPFRDCLHVLSKNIQLNDNLSGPNKLTRYCIVFTAAGAGSDETK
jgi:hypothetical protein